MPDVLALVSIMGPMNTAYTVLPLAQAAEVPIIAPLTGATQYPAPSNRYAVNLRVGYNDELLAMLYLLVTKKKYKWITMIYDDDALGPVI